MKKEQANLNANFQMMLPMLRVCVSRPPQNPTQSTICWQKIFNWVSHHFPTSCSAIPFLCPARLSVHWLAAQKNTPKNAPTTYAHKNKSLGAGDGEERIVLLPSISSSSISTSILLIIQTGVFSFSLINGIISIDLDLRRMFININSPSISA